MGKSHMRFGDPSGYGWIGDETYVSRKSRETHKIRKVSMHGRRRNKKTCTACNKSRSGDGRRNRSKKFYESKKHIKKGCDFQPKIHVKRNNEGVGYSECCICYEDVYMYGYNQVQCGPKKCVKTVCHYCKVGHWNAGHDDCPMCRSHPVEISGWAEAVPADILYQEARNACSADLELDLESELLRQQEEDEAAAEEARYDDHAEFERRRNGEEVDSSSEEGESPTRETAEPEPEPEPEPESDPEVSTDDECVALDSSSDNSSDSSSDSSSDDDGLSNTERGRRSSRKRRAVRRATFFIHRNKK
jgi:hypothetical protein